ncbi:unnamed protein product [Eretmochelys imbricata]
MALQINFIGPLPRTQKGNQYLLVVVNPFSKWVKAFPLKANTAKAAARVLGKQVFSQWESHFTGQFFMNCFKLMKVLQKLHMPHKPQSSGVVKQTNRTLKVMFKKPKCRRIHLVPDPCSQQ